MQAILAVTVPFFALVLLGWFGTRSGPLPESAIPGLNVYVLFFALPCMLFRFGSSLPIGKLVDPTLIAIYLGCALAMVALTLAVTLRRRGHDGVDLRDAAFGALAAAFPNAGFMGVPLLVALFGDAAAGPVIGVIIVDLVVTTTLCLALAQAGEHRSAMRVEGQGSPWRNTLPMGSSAGSGSKRRAARAAILSLRGALANPLPWAIVAGAAFGATGLALPGTLAQIVRMLGDSASPVALFTIGAVLYRAGRHAHSRTPLARYLPVAAIKNLLHPALVLGVALAARAAGADVSPFGLMVLVLTAALPSASNASILAERYGADNGRVTRIIMASTVFAFVSFTAIAAAFERFGRP